MIGRPEVQGLLDVLGRLRYGAQLSLARPMDRPPAPKVLSYAVTWRCNCRCVMCDNDAIPEDRKKSVAELSTAEVAGIFSDPILGDLDVVRITGGEPLCREDLAEIVQGIQQSASPRILYLTTNGSMPARLEAVVERALGAESVFHLQFSLDAIGAVHDRIRGLSGLYEKVIESFERMRRLRLRRVFYVGVTQTLLRENLDHADRVRALAREYGFGYKAVPAYRYHENNIEGYDTRSAAAPFRVRSGFSREEAETLFRKTGILEPGNWRHPLDASRLSALLWNLGEGYLREGGRNRLLKNLDRPRPRCVALSAYLRILPDGEVVPCTLMAESAGNLKEEDFSTVWSSKEAAGIREMVARCRGCWVECDILPSLFYTTEIIRWGLRRGIRYLFRRDTTADDPARRSR